jgi:hypothetical protein
MWYFYKQLNFLISFTIIGFEKIEVDISRIRTFEFLSVTKWLFQI